MKQSPELIKGDYTWCFSKQRMCGNKRAVCLITKGDTTVGRLFWHPAAKQIVWDGRCSCTKALLDFVLPILDPKNFYKMSKFDKKMKGPK